MAVCSRFTRKHSPGCSKPCCFDSNCLKSRLVALSPGLSLPFARIGSCYQAPVSFSLTFDLLFKIYGIVQTDTPVVSHQIRKTYPHPTASRQQERIIVGDRRKAQNYAISKPP